MNRLTNKAALIIGGMMILLIGLPSNAQVRVPFTQRTAAITPNQKIYNIRGDFQMIGNTDVMSIPMLYAYRTDYWKVELLKIRINATPEEAAKLDLSLLTAFSTLKFVHYEYRHNSCGDNKDTCLRAQTENQVNIPADSSLKILYLPSIPE